MTDEELLRYSRHILLDEIGITGQQRILEARVLIVGLGGLGAPAALYMASSGVGQLVLVDHDQVELSNLQRQIIHTESRVGQFKVDSAAQGVAAVNSTTKVTCLAQKADADLLNQQVAQADVVLDCTDNFETRHAINQACVKHRVPLVSAAAIGFKGQLSVYNARDERCPCYACVFPPNDPPPPLHCATSGVFAPLTGMMGTMQAAQALAIVSGMDVALCGSLLMWDAQRMESKSIVLKRQSSCTVCSQSQGHPLVG